MVHITHRPDRTVDVGDRTLLLSNVIEISKVDNGSFYWLDEHTGAIAFYPSALVPVPGGGESRWPEGGSVDIIDLDTGVSRTVVSDGTLRDVDRAHRRFLVAGLEDGDVPVLQVIDWDGNLIDSLAGTMPHGAFLSDGSVAVADNDEIADWTPGSKDVQWNDLPAALATGQQDVYVYSVGDDVFANGDLSGAAALLDPRTGEVTGSEWSHEIGTDPAVSPDGSQFAIGAPLPNGDITDAIQIRDSTTAQVVSATEGNPDRGLMEVLWPTDHIILTLGAKQGMKVGDSYPRFLVGYLIDGMSPIALSPLVAGETSIHMSASRIIVMSGRSSLLIAAVSEAPSGR